MTPFFSGHSFAPRDVNSRKLVVVVPAEVMKCKFVTIIKTKESMEEERKYCIFFSLRELSKHV